MCISLTNDAIAWNRALHHRYERACHICILIHENDFGHVGKAKVKDLPDLRYSLLPPREKVKNQLSAALSKIVWLI